MTLAFPGMKPKELLTAVRRQHHEASEKQVSRAVMAITSPPRPTQAGLEAWRIWLWGCAAAMTLWPVQPSEQLRRPHTMVGVNVVAADSDAEARRLFTSAQQRAARMVRGERGLLPAPIDDIEAFWSPAEKAQASRMLACSFVGAAETVRQGLDAFVAETGADELIVAASVHDHAARLRSYEILAGLQVELPRSGEL